MKRITAILLILLAANLIAGAALSSQSSFAGITGPAGAVVSTPGTDVKKVEDKMADALAKMNSWKTAQEKEKIEPVAGSTGQAESSSSSIEVNSTEVNSTESNLTSANSTLQNSSIISPPGNSSFEGSSGESGSDAGKVDGSDANVPSDQKIGSSSGERFKGYYGMTAARHEIGKSGISSRMSLSGDFEMDKTVKFQDQGFD
jgi:hypothetical protein